MRIVRRFLLLLAVALHMAAGALAQSTCNDRWFFDPTISVETGTTPTAILVHSYAYFSSLTFPFNPIVTRTGNQITLTYQAAPGPSAVNEWNDVVSLGALPPGHYTLTGLFRNVETGVLCPYASTSFDVALSVPILSPRTLAAFCLAVAAVGFALLRFRTGPGA